MKNEEEKYIYTLTDEEVAEHPFVKDKKAEFYNFIVRKITGLSYDDIQSMDCRLINVAENIQRSWYEHAEENGMSRRELTTLLLVGPKCDKSLADNRIEIYPRCIEIEEGVFYEPDRDSGEDAA